jgi:hypothetical protein
MRRSRIWVACLAVIVALGFPPPASAGGGSFVIANTASGFAEPVPRGALLTLHTDIPVSVNGSKFLPWVTETSDGLSVQAGCTVLRNMLLPIESVSHDGRRVNVYYPNALGQEPFGRCDSDGTAQIRLRPGNGMGPEMVQTVVTVNGHPGIFTVGGVADGLHINGLDPMAITPLEECAAAPEVCPVATQGQQALLRLRLTGAEMFVCFPCESTTIFFELATVGDRGELGPWRRQTVIRVATTSTGVEEATIRLGPAGELEGGEYRLRVGQTTRPEMADPVAIRLGPPN